MESYVFKGSLGLLRTILSRILALSSFDWALAKGSCYILWCIGFGVLT